MTETCAICGKPLGKNPKQLSCRQLGYGHGNNCECFFGVGIECYKARMKQIKNLIKNS